MKRRHGSTPAHGDVVIDEALAAIEVEDLRELVRDELDWLDDETRARLANELVDRTARGGSVAIEGDLDRLLGLG